MDITQRSRVNIAALDDVERFIQTVHQLKAVALDLANRRARRSRLEFVLGEQVKILTQHAGELVKAHPRLADLWKHTQTELATLLSAPPCEAAAATRSAPCSPGARGADSTPS
jgi:hypothetical protein